MAIRLDDHLFPENFDPFHVIGAEDSVFWHALGSSPGDCVFDFYNVYLDGIGWRPLSQDWDYGASRERAVAYLNGEPAAS